MNSKVIGGIVVLIVVIIVAYALNQGQEDVSNEKSIEPAQDSSVFISDSVTLTKNNPDNVIEEEEKKTYTIIVSDSPIIGD